MLSRRNRIDTKTFTEIFPRGRSFVSGPLLLRKITDPLPQIPRFAIVVSKKVEQKANKRNSIRRALYNHLAHLLVTREIPPAFYIFMVQKKVVPSNVTPDYAADIDFLLKKATI